MKISLITLFMRLGAVILMGTVFFRLVEQWSWVDSYYFTVVTISTVGYGDFTPVTDLGKIGATILIFLGLGVFALAIQQFAKEHLAEREKHPGAIQRLVMRMNRQHHHRAEYGERHEHHDPHRPGREHPDRD